MNLKGFKKVQEDEKKAVLKNKHGHSITIAKDKLSKSHLNDLKGLPLHAAGGTGPIDLTDEEAVDKSAGYTPSFESHYGLNREQSQYVPNYGIPDSQLTGTQIAARDEAIDKAGSMGNSQADYGTPKRLANNMPVNDAPSSQDTASDAALDMSASSPPPEAAAPPEQSYTPPPPEQAAQAPSTPPAEQPQAVAPQQDKLEGMPTESSPADVYNQTKNQLYDEKGKFKNDLINGHIQAKTMGDLFAQKSTLGKIGTIFGMMLSGMGSAMAHQPNALLEMMGKELDRDLEAQKATGINAQNLYQLNLKSQLQKYEIPKMLAEGKMSQAQAAYYTQKAKIDADANFRIHANWIGLHKLNETVSKLPAGSPERIKGEQVLGALYPMIDHIDGNIIDKAGIAQAALSGINPKGTKTATNEGPVNYQAWNQLQLKSQMHMPGAPSEADLSNMTHEAKGLEEASALKNDFDKTFKELDSKFLAGKLTPHDRLSAVNSLKGKLAKIAEGRYTAMSADLINAMLPEAGDWGKTRQNKQDRDNRFFDILKSGTPTLARFNVLNQSPMLAGQSGNPGRQSQQQYKDGQSLILKDGSKAIIRGGKAYRQ